MARIKRDPDAPPVDEAILAAAQRLFREKGFQATSMKEIATRADLTAAAIYYHYANKQDILYQSLLGAVTSLVRACEPALINLPDDAVRALDSFVRCHILHQFSNIGDVATTYSAVVYGSRERTNLLKLEQQRELSQLERSHFGNLRDILEAGRNAGVFHFVDSTVIAFSIIGACEHIVHWARQGRRLTIEQIADAHADIALRIAGYCQSSQEFVGEPAESSKLTKN